MDKNTLKTVVAVVALVVVVGAATAIATALIISERDDWPDKDDWLDKDDWKVMEAEHMESMEAVKSMGDDPYEKSAPGDLDELDNLDAMIGSVAPLLGMLFEDGPDGEAMQSQTSSGSSESGIWVTGEGSLTLEPDLAILSLGVEARGETVSETLADASTAMDAVVNALSGRGIQDRDVQTQYFNISPQYEYPEIVESGTRTRTQVLVGYVVTNTVTARIRDLDSVGAVIDEVAAAGGDATRIDGLRFTVEDDSPYAVQLRKLAVDDALTKARHFADLAGVTLGRMVFISESGGGPVARSDSLFEYAAMPAAAAKVTSISGGELELRLNVQTVFDIE